MVLPQGDVNSPSSVSVESEEIGTLWAVYMYSEHICSLYPHYLANPPARARTGKGVGDFVGKKFNQ